MPLRGKLNDFAMLKDDACNIPCLLIYSEMMFVPQLRWFQFA